MADDRGVTVVIVTTNEADVVRGLLDSMPAALAGIPSYELVIADNCSVDGTLDVVRQHFPEATTVQMGRNAGYAAALNAGVAAARPTAAVLMLNPDIRLRPGSVARLLAALSLPRTGIAVPRLLEADGGLNPSLRREPTVLRALGEALLGGRRSGRVAALGEMVADPASYEVAGTADWASGAAMLVSWPCLEAIGPLDESFWLYSEETEFALRARDAGFSLRYVPDAVAVHLGGARHRSPRLWSILTVNRVRLFARRHGRLETAAFWGAVTLNEGLRLLVRRFSPVHRASFWALLHPSRWPQEPSR